MRLLIALSSGGQTAAIVVRGPDLRGVLVGGPRPLLAGAGGPRPSAPWLLSAFGASARETCAMAPTPFGRGAASVPGYGTAVAAHTRRASFFGCRFAFASMLSSPHGHRLHTAQGRGRGAPRAASRQKKKSHSCPPWLAAAGQAMPPPAPQPATYAADAALGGCAPRPPGPTEEKVKTTGVFGVGAHKPLKVFNASRCRLTPSKPRRHEHGAAWRHNAAKPEPPCVDSHPPSSQSRAGAREAQATKNHT